MKYIRAGSLNLTGLARSLGADTNANIDGTLTVDGQIVSQVTSGAALVIPTTTKINNLNADLLDGTNNYFCYALLLLLVTLAVTSANQITAASGVVLLQVS